MTYDDDERTVGVAVHLVGIRNCVLNELHQTNQATDHHIRFFCSRKIFNVDSRKYLLFCQAASLSCDVAVIVKMKKKCYFKIVSAKFEYYLHCMKPLNLR
ncbi:UPF0061 protein isoform X1 [Gossypium australe]|uniref:UPF0061 protein isoform X1 n=1 Tax=Gossypium australe TaxID=47621 RepID=A0A5B6X8Y7_9ROSI|nr:UPF0061 protein isoform X1 [Gossypium australe]